MNVKLLLNVCTGDAILLKRSSRELDRLKIVCFLLCHLFYEIENLPPDSIRALNDEINRLVSSKGHWDRRIRELGGIIPDAADQVEYEELEGDAVFNGGGSSYKYLTNLSYSHFHFTSYW